MSRFLRGRRDKEPGPRRSRVITGAAALAAAAAVGVGGALALDSGGGTTTTTTTVTTTTTTTTPPAQGYPSLARIDFDGDFDPGCSLTGSNGGWDRDLSGSDHPGVATIASPPGGAGEGNCAGKFTNPPTTGPSDMTRSAVERHATGPDPELTYEALVYVPSGQTFPKGATIFGAKQPNSCFNGGVEINDGTGTTGGTMEFRTVATCPPPEVDFQMGPLPRDKWFAVKVHQRWSQNPSIGFVEVWLDPDGAGPAGYNNVVPKHFLDDEAASGPMTVRLRATQYRQSTNHTTTIYMDGYHMQCVANC
jgi:hypothetical protein